MWSIFAPDIPGHNRRGMRAAILGSIFKVVSSLTFSNGVMLLYLTSLGFSGSTVVLLLSMYNVLQAVLLVPAASLSDSYGPRRMGIYGIFICGVSFLCLPIAGWLPRGSNALLGALAIGIAIYGIGAAMQLGGWYSLLGAVVTPALRGRFFGVLRVSWQMTGIVYAGLVTFLLGNNTSMWVLQIVLIFAAVCVLPWGLYYATMPEVVPERHAREPLAGALLRAARTPGYAPFCAYVFVIQLFTGGCISLFGLVEKQAMGLSGGTVVLLANMTMIGSVLGYWLGGLAVDRLGTKPIFLLCHFGYGAAIFLFLARDLLGAPVVLALGFIHLLFGFPLAASSIAISAEMMGLTPERGRSVFTSICQALALAGTAFSGVLAGCGLRAGLFAESWRLAGRLRSSFDSVLVIQAVMVVVMTVTLGLVPSVLNKAGRR